MSLCSEYNNICVFDVECTCQEDNDGFVQEIIQIGAVKLSNNFNIISKFDIYIKPVINPSLSIYCTNLTNIAQNFIDKHGISFNLAIKLFFDFVSDCKTLYTWGDADKKYILDDVISNEDLLISKKIEYISIIACRHKNVKDLFSYSVGVHPRDLNYSMKYFNIKSSIQQHNALNDSINTANILKILVNKKNTKCKKNQHYISN